MEMPDDAPGRLGPLLKRLRARLDLTQDALAELAGCAVYTVRTYEMGTRRPSREMAERLADVLGLAGPERAELLRLARAPLPPAGGPPEPEPPRPRPAALPAAHGPLIGRAAELAALAARLRDPACRLLTILGPGGAGKTRLAAQLAADLAAGGEEVVWVDLAPLADPAQLPGALGEALGIAPAGDPRAALLEGLAGRRALIVLDNAEHLLAGAPLLADALLAAPGVRLLATTRERLGIRAEWLFELGGLELPAPGPAGERAAAAQLFLERARQADGAFALGPRTTPAVARICRALGGSPLGIELAAAWVRLLPCEQIADEIERSLDFLAQPGRDAPPRHRSLRAVFEHSWRLLGAPERRALARLAVLRGAWDLEAASAVALASPPAVAALADAALVRRAGAAGRFTLHELVRQYALEQLSADPADAEATQGRHAAYYAARLRDLVGALQSGAQPAALARLTPDLDDVWAAWGRLVRQRDAAALAEVARGVVTVCEDLGRLADAERLLADAAGAVGGVAGAAAADLLSWHGYFLARLGHPAAAEGRLREALARDPAGSPGPRGRAATHLALLLLQQGRAGEAAGWAADAAPLLATAGDGFYEGLAACFAGMAAAAAGDARADGLLARAEALWRANGYPRGLALVLGAQARRAAGRGDAALALDLAREGVRLCALQRDRWGLAFALWRLGEAALAAGDSAEAGYLLAESAEASLEVGEQWVRCHALAAAGRAALAAGRPGQAAVLLRQALAAAAPLRLAPAALEARLGLALLAAADDPVAAAEDLAAVARDPAAEPLVRAEAAAALGWLGEAG